MDGFARNFAQVVVSQT